MRDTYISRDVMAGCYTCYGNDAHWLSKNAQGVAARHHDATGHRTWVQVVMSIRYGEPDKTTASDAPQGREG